METVTLYLDVLFFYNFFLNLLILFFVSFASDRKFLVWRSLLASGIGSVYVCLLMMEAVPRTEHIVFRLLVSFFMIFTAFRIHKFREFLKLVILYYLLNFMLAGGIRFSASFGSGGLTIVSVIVGAFLLFFFGQTYFISLKKKSITGVRTVTVTHNGKTLLLRAFPDTGNTLKEPVEQSSVIVVRQELLQNFIGTKDTDAIKHLRLIPCSTVTDRQAVLWGFKPDSVICENKPLRVVLAASPSLQSTEYDAVFNPIILIS